MSELKQIIAPTDFSIPAENAVLYAVQLAAQLDAEVTILHVFSLPVPTADAALPVVPIQEISEAAERRMKKYFNELTLTYPLVKMNYFICGGFVVDEICNYCELNKCDLLVTGITGGGKFKEKFIGSTALSLIRISGCNVLLIPPDAVFKKPKKLVLATNYEALDETALTETILPYVRSFDAEIDILTVVQKETIPSTSMAAAGIKFHYMLEGINHDFKLVENSNVAEGIGNYISSHAVDWLVTIPKKHNFFSLLFRGSITNKLAFHTHVPILALFIKSNT